MVSAVSKIIVNCLWYWAQGHKVSIPWNDGLTFRPVLNKYTKTCLLRKVSF